MARENSYLSIILKKQPYGEGDELVTVFTRETGKLRALAKSTKLPKSKLQYGLQVLFLSRLRLAQARLPKVIGTEILQVFPHLREQLETMNIAFYVLELVIKFTADEQKNEQLFDLLVDFLSFLDRADNNAGRLAAGLAKFKIDFLSCIGFAVHADPPTEIIRVGFSNSRGGFMFSGESADYQRLNPKTFEQFQALGRVSFSDLLDGGNVEPGVGELQEVLSGFLEYYLERNLKSERFLPE